MSSLMEAGVELMLIGMGTVFVFLTLLVVATTLMSSLALRLTPTVSTSAQGPSPEEVAAITLALEQHRQRHPPN